jgi:DNA-binding NtrC family response regulator
MAETLIVNWIRKNYAMETLTVLPKFSTGNGEEKKNEVRIAIVEDDPMYRHAIEYYLGKIPGNRLFSFDSGEECFKYYHLLDPEIMVLDYRLNELFESGNMDGLDILREVKSVKPETEIIFLSGQENFDVATAAIKGGAAEYIVKDMNALGKLQKEVSRMAAYVRLKREEMLQTKRIIILLSAIVGVLLLTYLSGYFIASMVWKMTMTVLVAGTLGYILFRNRKKRNSQHEIKKSPPVEKPGSWHD